MPSTPSSPENLAAKLGRLLVKRNLTIATAESCTGGLIGGALTAIRGSSAYVRGGIIAYSNDIKQKLLSVPKKVLIAHGAVSSETAHAMAIGAQKKLNADCSIAVTGIAGPDGGTKEKPVGLVYVAICCKDVAKVKKCLFKGSRQEVREQTVCAALKILCEMLSSVN
jgi:PncC family amidohydrolase